MVDWTYTEQAALIDIGFVIGYIEQAMDSEAIKDENEGLWHLIGRINDFSGKGLLYEGQTAEEARRLFVLSIGELKGRLWHTPIPNAISDALDRLTGYYAKHWIRSEEDADILRPCETDSESLSDHQRSQLLTVARQAVDDPMSTEIAKEIGASHEAVVSYWQSMGAIDESEALSIIADCATKKTVTEANEDSVTEPEDERPVEEDVLPEHVATTRKQYEWEPWQKEKLLEMKDGGSSWDEIVAVVGRDTSKCRAMYHNEKKKRQKQESDNESRVAASGEEPDPVSRFLERGGTITKLPTRYADGVH
jgi:hypothetical protein